MRLLLVLCLLASSVNATELPRYGGTLNVGTVYITLSALSWDPADWTWKSNHDAGMMREQLFVGDLSKSVGNGGEYPFIADAYLPEGAIRGELAESWTWETPLTLAITLRRGVRFAPKPGVIDNRELTADDVVFSFEYIRDSPKRISSFLTHIDRVEARDSHTVVFHFNQYHAEWDYRFGYGYYSSIVPREILAVDAKDWRNAVGTGPFTLKRYIHGNSHHYVRNPNYWDAIERGGKRYQLPFLNDVKYRIIKDEATYLTGLRTGKLDILEGIRWIAVDHLKETTPELQWNRWLGTGGNFMVMRLDREPFDDIRVRRALNLAVDQRAIVELFYGGHAELMAYPQHPGFGNVFEPLEEMPASVQALFDYRPDEARALLAQAGLKDGFTVTVQVCSCSPNNMDLVPLLAGYLADVGVTLNIQPLEYASFLSVMTTRNHSAAYLMNSGHVNPTTTLRKNFGTDQLWNPSMYSNPEVDATIREIHLTRDRSKREAMLRALTVRMLDEAPYLWLPTAYIYTAWWPWVRNYHGELRVGAVRPGPIYARMWIDEDMKRELGFDD